ncbi:indole-3-glycerol phosphate synthase TrpC [Sporosarcina siberiensis]|uniref:Indole-3-glycerol phosphate synthase n=1 Tax=Sporosarcina siberiensis TaxID=1365606 RepID=A0ABW4SJ71_9BACL
MTILDDIIAQKRFEVAEMRADDKVVHSRNILRPSLFKRLYEASHLQVIAEMKRASPSKGLIAGGANPVEQASAYFNAGAACISVLTDKTFFKGSFNDLAAVAEVVPIPLLCKDFMIDPIQIDRAKAAGASVILLIVAALNDEELTGLYSYATGLGLEVLVEVHDVEELKRALAVDAKLIGVNNRDLRTFEVDLARTEEISAVFPFGEQRVLISESGITGRVDAERISGMGAKAILVGETLMRSGTIEDTLRSMQVEVTGLSR